MKRKCLLLTLVLTTLLLCACGAAAKEAPAETPEPTPETRPFAEPAARPGGTLYMNARELPGGRLLLDGEAYMKLSEVAEALDTELLHEEGSSDFVLPWRKSRVELTAENRTARYLEEERQLSAAPVLCSQGEDLLVPVESFCQAAEIGYFYDEEFDTVYCTPASGDWKLPENYVVPVLMYHELGHASEEAELYVKVSSLEEQIQWLLENDYSLVWFEDLWHVEDFSKPVIMVFDDGYRSMYTKLLPLLEKYQVKAEVAVVNAFNTKVGGMHMDPDQLEALRDSGLVALSSHGMNHLNVGGWDVDAEYEIHESALWLTRFLHKEPITFVYPYGGSTPAAQELVRRDYRFAVKMVGAPYNTSDDPTMVYRYYIRRQTSLPSFKRMMELAFNDPEINNYVPRNKG